MLFLYLLSATFGTLLLSLCGVFGLLQFYVPESYVLGGLSFAGTPINCRAAHFISGFFSILILTFPYILTLFWFEGACRSLSQEIQAKRPRLSADFQKQIQSFRQKFRRLAGVSLTIIILGLLSGGATRSLIPVWVHIVGVVIAYLQNLYGLLRIGEELVEYFLVVDQIWKKLSP